MSNSSDSNSSAPTTPEETDYRFPSGPWTGFFLDRRMPGRHLMELQLSFREGTMTGEGRDHVGPFLIRGRYFVDGGQCHWTKQYLKKHSIFYRGYNEGKGIWGVWELNIHGILVRGGFHIWPEGQGVSGGDELGVELEQPVSTEPRELIGAPG